VLEEWILTAISSESLDAGFKMCCILNALDGTEDDFLWQDAEDENNESDCEEEDILWKKVRMGILSKNLNFQRVL
jgi:hypothetical protein